MSEASPEIRKLPLRRVIFGAFSLPWQHRTDVFRATALPLLAVIAFSLLSGVLYSDPSLAVKIAVPAAYCIALSALAIAVHRLVLMETGKTPEKFDLPGLRRLVLFFAAFVGVWIVYWALTALIAGVVLNILTPPRYVPAGADPRDLPGPDRLPVSFELIMDAAKFLAFWLIARMSLMFPAIAVDRGADLLAAWRLSKGNGWRLAVVVGALPWCLERLTNILYRDGATSAEYGALVVLATIFIIIAVTALSLSYWELTAPAPPPKDPPA